MLSQPEVDQWLHGFDYEVQEALKVASSREEWVLDEDQDVQKLCDLISQAVMVERVEEETGEVIKEYDYSLLGNVSLENLSVLQSQLSIIRSIKLFGDLCYADSERALAMLNIQASDSMVDELKTATEILIKRINLLISLQLIKRVFADERRKLVLDVILNKFSE